MSPTPILVALAIVLLLIVGVYWWRHRAKGCTSDSDCPPHQLCANGFCTPPALTPEVYLCDVGRYGLDLASAQAIAQRLGGSIATMAQLAASQAAGAQWCWAGWTANDTGGHSIAYPMQITAHNCSYKPGVQIFSSNPSPSGTYGVNVFGIKPPPNAFPVCGTSGSTGSTPCVLGFYNIVPGITPPDPGTAKWSQFS